MINKLKPSYFYNIPIENLWGWLNRIFWLPQVGSFLKPVTQRIWLGVLLLVNSPTYAVDLLWPPLNEGDPPFTVDLTQYFLLPATDNFYAINQTPSLLSVSQSAEDYFLGIICCINKGKFVEVTLLPDQYGSATIETAGDLTWPSSAPLGDTKLFLKITVNPINDAPVANSIDPLTTNEDTPIHGTFSATDVDNPVLTYRLVKNGYRGRVTITNPNTGAFTYTPYPDVNGTDSFSFKATDGLLDSNVVTVNVTINPVNDAPFLVASNPPTRHDNFGGAVTFEKWATFNPGKPNEMTQKRLTDYLVSNLSDPSLFVIPPVVDEEGTLTYTLTSGKWGSSTFEVTVQDDGGTEYGGVDISAPQKFTIFVTPYPLPNQSSLFLQIDGSGRGQVTSDTGLACQSNDCQKNPDGSLICNPQTCSQIIQTATEVLLTPQADEGSYFSSWSGHPSCANQPLFLNSAMLCVAYFRLLQEPLTVVIQGQGSVIAPDLDCQTSPCVTNLPYGTNLTLQPQPAPGWQFEAWSGDCSNTGEVVMTSTKNCGATFIAVDEDLDHIPSVVEDQGPNNGDGNGDGIPDRQQNNISNFLDAVNGVYLTLQVAEGCPITDVYGELPDKYPGRDRNHLFPQGLTYFELGCSQSQVTLYFHAFSAIRKNLIFYKFGPTVPGDLETLAWYQYPATFAITMIGGKPVVTATYTLTDGQLGDSTGVDGQIVDPAGLGLK